MAPGEGGGQGSHTATRCCWLLSAAGLSQPRWPRRRGVGAEVCVVRGVGRPRQAARRATAGVERQRHPGASSASRPAQARRKPPSNSLVALAAGTTPRPRVAVCPGVLHSRPRPPPLTAGCGVAVSARADWLHARTVATSVFCCSARAGCVGARAWRRPSHVQPGGRAHCPVTEAPSQTSCVGVLAEQRTHCACYATVVRDRLGRWPGCWTLQAASSPPLPSTLSRVGQLAFGGWLAALAGGRVGGVGAWLFVLPLRVMAPPG